METLTGKLFYNYENDRIGVIFENDEVETGLHCGKTMEVNIGGKWIPTRIEMGRTWYLVGINVEDIVGLQVRL